MKETNVNIKTIYELLNQPNENIDNKIILEILSRIITNINHLKQRKYVIIYNNDNNYCIRNLKT